MSKNRDNAQIVDGVFQCVSKYEKITSQIQYK